MSRSAPASASPRHPGVEGMRFLLCYAVILLHLIGQPQPGWQVVAMALCDAAVPFFFIASGFFSRVDPGAPLAAIATPVRRLLIVYVSWLAIYYAVARLESGHLPAIGLRGLVTGGIAYHLWFLPALMFATTLVGLGYRSGWRRATLLVCLSLAAVSLLSGPVAAAWSMPPFPAVRALAAPLYFVGGRIWADRGWAPGALPSLIAVAGFWLLSAGSGWPLVTYPLGLAVFALALSMEVRIGRRLIAALGSLSLGIYSVHLMLFSVVLPRADNGVLPQALGKAAAVLAAAAVVSLVLASLPWLWRLASYRRLRIGRTAGSAG